LYNESENKDSVLLTTCYSGNGSYGMKVGSCGAADCYDYEPYYW